MRKTRPQRPTTKSESEEGLTIKAYRKLEEMIVTLVLEPGSVVSEAELAERVGIGRTPIREAIQRLSRERLIKIMPSRGCVITEINIDEQLKLLELRRELEGLLVRSAAVRANEQERSAFGQLSSGFEATLKTGDFEDFRRLDADFNALCEITCRNELVASAVRRINPLARRFWFIHHGKTLPELGVMAHAEMARAINRADPASASAASKKLCDYIEETTRKSLIFGGSHSELR